MGRERGPSSERESLSKKGVGKGTRDAVRKDGLIAIRGRRIPKTAKTYTGKDGPTLAATDVEKGEW